MKKPMTPAIEGSAAEETAESPAVEATEDDGKYDSWRAKDDMRTLIEAKRIEKDPARMKCVKRAAKEQLDEMKAIKALASGG